MLFLNHVRLLKVTFTLWLFCFVWKQIVWLKSVHILLGSLYHFPFQAFPYRFVSSNFLPVATTNHSLWEWEGDLSSPTDVGSCGPLYRNRSVFSVLIPYHSRVQMKRSKLSVIVLLLIPVWRLCSHFSRHRSRKQCWPLCFAGTR